MSRRLSEEQPIFVIIIESIQRCRFNQIRLGENSIWENSIWENDHCEENRLLISGIFLRNIYNHTLKVVKESNKQ